ncbi:fimbria/pilus outer membrane usher protein [Pseudomonas sp. NPDC086251]|uniref:fimbria/pilus outer membrane usher protein n=1 Tax=Pseudomonas sp. NPDC086251 TaxID=3364431 RepID=UPI003833F9B7
MRVTRLFHPIVPGLFIPLMLASSLAVGEPISAADPDRSVEGTPQGELAASALPALSAATAVLPREATDPPSADSEASSTAQPTAPLTAVTRIPGLTGVSAATAMTTSAVVSVPVAPLDSIEVTSTAPSASGATVSPAGVPATALAQRSKNESAGQTSDTGVVFDIDTLISRGIDPKLAAMFNDRARFLPGLHKVTLFVNGDNLGSVPVHFDTQGQLCFDRRLADKAGLLLPIDRPPTLPSAGDRQGQTAAGQMADAEAALMASLDTALKASTGAFSTWADIPGNTAVSSIDLSEASPCFDFMALYPQTDVDLRPNKEEVRLAVPSNALKPFEQDFSGYSSGGMAAILNYDALKTQSQFSGTTSDFTSVNTELGLNLGDWSVRSRQTFTDQNGKRNTDQLYTYAEHSFVPFKSVLQVGQLNLFNAVLPGASITGVQVVPDSALRAQASGGITIDGIANTPQARVEVKQDGILIYSTVVPAGPFQLTNVPLLRGNANVDVTVFESDNSRNTFSLPAASLHQVELTTNGLSVAVGKVRNINDTSGLEEPMVVSAGDDWLISASDKLSAGVMVAQDYNAIGAIADHVLSQDTRLSLSTTVSQAQALGKSGVEGSLMLSSRLTERFSVNGSVTRQTSGYRALMDSVQSTQEQEDFAGDERTQFNVGASWSSPTYGGFGMNFMQSLNHDNAWDRTMSLSWGNTIAGVSINASVQHDISGDIPNSAYLSFTIPLGSSRSLRTYASRTSAEQQQVGTTYNETVNDMLNYSLTMGQQLGSGSDRDVTLGGNVSALPYYAQVSAGYTDNGAHSSNYNVGGSGALVLHATGLTASPYQIQDTFGIVSVGDAAGVKLISSNGPVWTDSSGQAVLARLPAFSDSQVEVVSYTLPRNADIDNGYKRIAAGRGSVNYLKFDVSKVRRVLLTVTDSDGKPLPKGAAVFDSAEQFVTVVLDEGKIYLNDISQGDLHVSLRGGGDCHVTFHVEAQGNTEGLFEQVPAVCLAQGRATPTSKVTPPGP